MKRSIKKSLSKIFTFLFISIYTITPPSLSITQVIALDKTQENITMESDTSGEILSPAASDYQPPVEETPLTEDLSEIQSETPTVDLNPNISLNTLTTLDTPHTYVWNCENDLQGADDEPGQKDLTKMCSDYTDISLGKIYIKWDWNDIAWSGANTGDACALFDSDGDGNANYSLCVRVDETPATYIEHKLYSCTDTSMSKCFGSTLISPITSICTASVLDGTDPFNSGSDTVAECDINISDVPDSNLIDVCSYPSGQPNSDPSDCIKYETKSGKLEIIKDLYPSTDTGLFNLYIGDSQYATNIGDGGSTGEQVLERGTYTISEQAGSNTSLSNYSTSIQCKDQNGLGNVIASNENSTSMDVTLAEDQDVVCTIANTKHTGSVKVNKFLDNDGNGTFETANPQEYTWSIDGSGTNVMGSTLSNILIGNHTINETSKPNYHFVGWYPTSNTAYSCTSPYSDILPANISVSDSQATEITLCNAADKGRLIVQKTTYPAADPAEFSITASTTNGNIEGSTSGTISDTSDKTYTVSVGTYSVSEIVPYGWDLTSNTCNNIDISAGETEYCTITNTKRGSISGYKYNDADGSDQTTNDRTPISGWTIYIDSNDNGILDPGEQSTTTLNGYYEFLNLQPDAYVIREQIKTGWFQLSGERISLTLTPGENKENINFVNVKKGSITVLKNVDENGDGDLSDIGLDVIGATNWQWKLNDTTYTTGQTASDLIPGTYTISEIQKDNYHVTSLTCTNGLATSVLSQSVTISSGEDLVCTFTNTRNLGTLIIKKIIINDNGGEITNNNAFSFRINGGDPIQFENDGQNEYVKYSGIGYTIREVEENSRGYSTTYDNCDNIIVPANGTATCTITNNDIAPTLKLTKNVVNDNGGNAKPSDWTLTATGSVNSFSDTGNSTTFHTVKAGIPYTLSESGPSGYSASMWNCSNGQTNTNTVTPNINENITCTITNDDIAPKLTVTKIIDNKQYGSKNISDFNLYVGDTSVTSGVQNEFNAGSYVVREDNLPGYTSEISGNCDSDGDIALSVGDVKACTITNTSTHGKIIIKKITNPTESTQKFTFTGDVTGSIGNNEEIEKVVIPGTYTVSENITDGWDLTSINCDDNNSKTSLTNSNTAEINIENNETVTCTFTNTQRGSVSGIKWLDSNANGIQDGSEPGIQGWTIHLRDSSNSENLRSFTTISNGTYLLENVEPGTYSICEENKPGYYQSYPSQGSTYDGLYCHQIVLSPGENKSLINFGNYQTTTISGIKFNDQNENTIKDLEEPGISNWQIYLDENTNGQYDTGIDILTTTDQNGSYIFTDLTPGTYKVCEIQQDGWIKTYPLTSTSCHNPVTISSGNSETLNFGNFKLGEISGIKFEDINGNGAKDTEESGLENWKIFIDENHNNVFDVDEPSTFTDETGYYSFEGLHFGTYTIREQNQTGWIQTTDSPQDISIQSGSNEENTNFGNFKLGSISGMKFEDTNGNGVKDTNEPSLSNWKIYIDGNHNSTFDTDEPFTLTNGSGSYTFTNLAYGTYTIREVVPEGWTQTTNNPEDVLIESGTNATGKDFGNFADVTINVHKDVVDINEEDTSDNTEFNVTLNGTDQKVISESSDAKYTVNTSGPYTIEEIEDPNYISLGCKIDNEILAEEFSVESGDTYDITCTNKQKPVSITVIKDVTDNRKENIYSNDIFEVQLTKGEDILGTEPISDTQAKPLRAVFDQLNPGTYSFTELYKDGYQFTGCYPQELVTILEYNRYNPEVTLNSNENITYVCSNEVIDPILLITKSNDSLLTGMYPEEYVTYSMTITAPDDEQDGTYLLKNVKVTDIPPKGFGYISGSWTSTKPGVLEPTYINGQPVIWSLGGMKEGDSVTITYKIKISATQAPGIYKDIAWTHGISVLEEEILGNKDTGIFVGTQVKVIARPVVDEGEVLGATIYLPKTGAETYITVISLISLITGAILMILKPKKRFLSLIVTPIIAIGIFSTSPAYAQVVDTVETRIDQLASPTKLNSFKIGYVVLDLQNRNLKIQCYETTKGAFGSEQTTNSGECIVDNSIITGSGTYEFYIKVTAGTYEELSEKVSVIVDLDKPLAVTEYTKTKNTCSYTLNFKTANDNQTSSIQIFRSDKTPFTANASTLITNLPVAPNTNTTYTDSSITDCSKTYYYAIRATDTLGNTSPIVTDNIVKIIETSANTNNNNNNTNNNGTGGPDETTTDTDTNTTPPDSSNDQDVKGEDVIADNTSDNSNENSSETTNNETSSQSNFWTENKSTIIWISIIVVAIALGVIGYRYANKGSKI